MIICILLIFGLITFTLFVDYPNEINIFWIIFIVCLIFLLIGLIGYCICKYNYLIVKPNRIIIKTIFKRIKIIKYDDIYYMSNFSYGFGQLACYDINGIPLFSIDHFYVGEDRLSEFLSTKGYLALPNPYPSEEMKKNKKFIKFKEKSSCKLKIMVFCISGIVLLLTGFLVNNVSNFTKYENIKVEGILDNFIHKEDIVELYLKDDENEYYINNIVYDYLDKTIFEVLENNISIQLYISYTDEYNRKNLSNIVIDQVSYIDIDKVEKAEYENYKWGNITSYALIGIGVLFLLFTIFQKIKLKKLDNE